MHQNIKPLKETLLECAAMNFRAVFSVFFDSPLMARKVKLPPGVFEEVLGKGKDIHFLVHFQYLEKLFPYRDVLRWENIDIEINITSTDLVRDDSFLKLMNEVQYPIRTLCIRCQDLSQEIMEQICAMGSTIECLSIFYFTRSAPVFLNASFPKLRRLFISVDPTASRPVTSLIIDLNRFSDTLEELMVGLERIDDSFINSLTSLKKLTVLALQDTRHHFPVSYDFKSSVFEKLGSMSRLRSLDLRYTNLTYFDERSFNSFSTMLTKLTDLKKLDLSFSTFSDPELEILKQILKHMNLEKLGLLLTVGNDYNELLADQVLTSRLESILSSIQTYMHRFNHCHRLMKILFQYFHLFQSHEMETFENILLDSLEESITIEYVLQYIRTGQCSPDFIMQVYKPFTD